ncbi:MAG: pyridoxal phosphate-dependent aminotransferase [Rhodothermales bacterium]
MAPPLARRTDSLVQSEIRAISKQVNDVGGINLGQGICDMPTPEPIRLAARQAIEANKSIYSNYAGIAALRESIARKSQSYNRIPLDSVEQIVVSAGSTGAFTAAALTLLNPGDEVVLFEPYYGYHRQILQTLGFGLRFAPLVRPGWAIQWKVLEDAITPATRAIVVTTPSNPSGKVWSRADLERLLSIADEHDLFVITDEIYEYMLYDGREHVSLASLPGAMDRTITISGFSKTFNMTGWRLGYAIAPAPIADKIGLMNDLLYICAPTPLQHGVAGAFDLPESYFSEMIEQYSAKRKLICQSLERSGFEFDWPEGAYYVLAGFEPLSRRRSGFDDDAQACQTLIAEAGIGTVRGASFFNDPDDGRFLLRFCFAKELPILEEACQNLERAFAPTRVGT